MAMIMAGMAPALAAEVLFMSPAVRKFRSTAIANRCSNLSVAFESPSF